MKAQFFTYFKLTQEKQSEQFADELKKLNYEVERSILDYAGGQWSVIINTEVKDEDNLMVVEDKIAGLTEKFGGEYDGNEVEI